jgi:hypothetical protein
VSWLGSGNPRQPMRNSRLFPLVRRLSFTLSTKYCGLSLLDTSNMFTLVRISVDLTPADVDVSLKDFPPASSETVLPFLPLPPSPVFVLSLLFTIFARGMEFFFSEKQKSRSNIFFNFQVFTHRDRGVNRSTHYPGNWIVSVRVRTEHPVQPLLYLPISKSYQLSSTDPPVSTVG